MGTDVVGTQVLAVPRAGLGGGRNSSAYLAFFRKGGGSRVCLGRGFVPRVPYCPVGKC